ncbi:MAG: phage holin family protein [Calditerrivibrio sp.]|nr:phage holin family protein [Calditerrivibrio sp.]
MGIIQFTLYKIFVNAIGLGISAFLFKHVKVESFGYVILGGFVLSLMNFLVKPFLILITFPFHLLTLGLFYFIVNALIILLVSALVKGYYVDGLWTAVGVSIVVSLINILFDIFYGKPKIDIKVRKF